MYIYIYIYNMCKCKYRYIMQYISTWAADLKIQGSAWLQ